MRFLVTLGACLLWLAPACAQDIKPAARDLWREAMDHHRAKDPARAMEAFLKAYHADPAVLGLENEGLLDGAVSHLRHQLDVKKDDLVYTFKLAELLNLKGSLTEAITTYRKVVAINPSSPMAQVASDEARKLESFRSALAAPSPSASSASSPAPTGSAVPSPEPADPGLSEEIKNLKEQNEQQKQELAKLQEEHEALKAEHDKLKADYEKAALYKTLFFANPKNVENLNRRQVR